jgi:hypothetical protein
MCLPIMEADVRLGMLDEETVHYYPSRSILRAGRSDSAAVCARQAQTRPAMYRNQDQGRGSEYAELDPVVAFAAAAQAIP